MFINFEECSVQVSVIPSIIKKLNACTDNWHSRVVVGQKMKCDVIFAHDDYILVMLRGHANGKLAFLPNKKVILVVHNASEHISRIVSHALFLKDRQRSAGENILFSQLAKFVCQSTWTEDKIKCYRQKKLIKKKNQLIIFL